MANSFWSLVLMSFLMLRLIYILEHGATRGSNTESTHTRSESVIISLWRRAKYLCPRLRRPTNMLPANYWLLLLAGDIEKNPGPARFPCTVCRKPVKRNQRGIECSKCAHWTHAKCGGVSPEEYVKVGEREDEPWLCPTCVTRELPFVNASLSFTNSNRSTL